MAKQEQTYASHITPIHYKGQDNEVIEPKAEPVDPFKQDYYTAGVTGQQGILIQPTYSFTTLQTLVQTNNTLGQCIEAMVTNIDGTGHTLEREDGEPIEDSDKKSANYQKADSFFSEPYPDQSMVTLRKNVRVDLESIGNGWVEIIPNMEGELVMLQHIPGGSMRIAKLDEEPVEVDMTVERDGEEQEVTILMRPRKYCQMLGNRKIWFKQAGINLDIHREEGTWHPPGELAFSETGNEVIHLTVNKDVATPYGVPRWINQIPSVIGSRNAEELNLEYFGTGGIPPVLIFLGNGHLTPDIRRQLEAILSGNAKTKNKGAVIEIQSMAGSIDKQEKVDVTVERFASEQQKDSMFTEYDKRSEDRVRSAFRLPPLFIGHSEDLNFASAFASYVVAESQVFVPERMEFDEMVNQIMMKLLGVTEYVFRSKKMSITSSEVKLKAVSLVKDYSDPESVLEVVNESAGIDLKPRPDGNFPIDSQPVGKPNNGLAETQEGSRTDTGEEGNVTKISTVV